MLRAEPGRLGSVVGLRFTVAKVATLERLIVHAVTGSTISIRILWFHVTLLHGGSPPTLVVVALVLVAVVFPAWAIGHAVGTPQSTFASIGRSKSRWIGWMLVLFLIGDFTSLLLAVYYLLRIRPELHRSSTATPVE